MNRDVILAIIITAINFLHALEVPSNHIVDTKWLKKYLNEKNLIIVDVRKDTRRKPTYSKAHIKGAIHWESKDFREGRYCNPRLQKPIPGYLAAPNTFKKTMQRSGVNSKTAIIFYADGTKADDIKSSALAAFTTIYYGHNNTAILDGGFAGWVKDMGEISNEKPIVQKSDFNITNFNRKILAVSEDIDEAITLKNSQLLDANGPGAHYDGTKKGDLRRMAEGHLPNAKALHIKDYMINIDGVWYFDSKENIEAKLKEIGIDINKPLITYCNDGYLAAGNWFVQEFILEMKNNRLYRASMADYTAMPNRPLETNVK